MRYYYHCMITLKVGGVIFQFLFFGGVVKIRCLWYIHHRGMIKL